MYCGDFAGLGCMTTSRRAHHSCSKRSLSWSSCAWCAVIADFVVRGVAKVLKVPGLDLESGTEQGTWFLGAVGCWAGSSSQSRNKKATREAMTMTMVMVRRIGGWTRWRLFPVGSRLLDLYLYASGRSNGGECRHCDTANT